eukprot:jgi/Tetstr1/449072/TSEL_036285.t1
MAKGGGGRGLPRRGGGAGGRGGRGSRLKDDLLKWRDPVVGGDGPSRGPTHVAKRKRAATGAEVVFDPAAHKEYLTGFHKRKLQRRKSAMKNLEKMEKQDRVERRAERRTQKKVQASQRLDHGLPVQLSDDEEDGGAGAPGGGKGKVAPAAEEVRVFDSGDMTSTVVISAIHNSSSESEREEEGGDLGEEGAEEGVSRGYVAGPMLSKGNPKAKKRSKILMNMKAKKQARQGGGGVAKRGGARGGKAEESGGGRKGGGGGGKKGGKKGGRGGGGKKGR